MFVILHDILNSTKERLRICGEEKPTAVVISRLFKLTPEDLLYALKQYHRQTTKIRNHRAYLLTVLYLAKEQNELDISNRVMHNMYGNKEG